MSGSVAGGVDTSSSSISGQGFVGTKGVPGLGSSVAGGLPGSVPSGCSRSHSSVGVSPRVPPSMGKSSGRLGAAGSFPSSGSRVSTVEVISTSKVRVASSPPYRSPAFTATMPVFGS